MDKRRTEGATAGRVPEADGLIVASRRDGVAIGAEGNGLDSVRVLEAVPKRDEAARPSRLRFARMTAPGRRPWSRC